MTEPRPHQQTINLRELPGLQAALWDRHDTHLSPEEVFHLYEDRWRYINPEEMSEQERQLLKWLTDEFGNGVFLGR